MLACGPIQFISQVTIRAEKSVAAAKLNQAEKYAPYEYWKAVSFLEEAKHRAGFGDYQTSYRYGKKAQKMADKAVKLSKRKKEEEGDVGGSDAPRETPESPRRVRP
jgi:hypothetical protein